MKAFHSKIIRGPGGIKCRCCGNGKNVKARRIALNRITRRASKISDKMLDGND